MSSVFQEASTYCLVVVFLAFIGLAGCENPGPVGSGLGETKAGVVVDTLSDNYITNLTTRTFNFYSGGFQFFSTGEYDDPLFGNMRTIGMIKPSLPMAVDDTLTSDSEMFMRLILDGSQVFGDTLADQSYDLYEIDELWRSSAFRIHEDIKLDEANGPISSFTVGTEDSLDIPLPQEWVDKYRAYSDTANADSLYEREVFGFALVPTNDSNKIIAPNASSTRFVVQNPVEEDTINTFNVRSDRWAYMLERGSGSSLPQGSVALHSTNERILSFGLDLSSLDIRAPDIARAELVLYQNNELMDQSMQSESPSADRPRVQAAQLHLVNTEQLPDNITPGSPIANGFYSADDGAYHFSVTSQIQNILTNDGLPEDNEYVVTLGPDGIIRSSVIYTDEAPADKRPKLIITSLKNNSN